MISGTSIGTEQSNNPLERMRRGWLDSDDNNNDKNGNSIDNINDKASVIRDMDSVCKEVDTLKYKVAYLEKQLTSNQLVASKGSKTPQSFADKLAANTFELSARNVEICAIVSCFFIGLTLGASLLDRLWLVGGVFGAYYGSVTVKNDTKMGSMMRKLGAELAGIIREYQEMFSQFMIFYRTGKLAYYSSKWWEKYDNRFGITTRANRLKRLAIDRASKVNAKLENGKFMDQAKDVWSTLLAAPRTARKLDSKYSITENSIYFFKGVASGIGDTVSDIMDRGGYAGSSSNNNINRNRRRNNNNGYGRRRRRRMVVDPWESPFTSIRKRKNRRGFAFY